MVNLDQYLMCIEFNDPCIINSTWVLKYPKWLPFIGCSIHSSLRTWKERKMSIAVSLYPSFWIFLYFLSHPEFCKEGLIKFCVANSSPTSIPRLTCPPNVPLNSSVIFGMIPLWAWYCLGFGLTICFFFHMYIFPLLTSQPRGLFSSHIILPLAAMHHNGSHFLPPLCSSPVPLIGLSSS